jgi:hypothetical protein
MAERDPELVFFWRRELQDVELQAYLDTYKYYLHLPQARYFWILFLEEKLRRVELEISI